VGVVPSMAILRGSEVVDVFRVAGDGALGDAIHAVHLIGAELADSVPVHGGAVVAVVVPHPDDDLVAPAGLDRGARVCAVEGDAADFGLAIRRQLSTSASVPAAAPGKERTVVLSTVR
jgi:hypothetical protein